MSNFNREAILARQAQILADAVGKAPAAMSGPGSHPAKSKAALGAPLPSHPVGEVSDEDYDEAVEAPEHVKGTRGVQMRNACITYWTPMKEPLQSYMPLTVGELSQHILKPAHDSIDFYVSVLEVAPTTNVLHGHIYMEFNQPKTVLQIQKIIGTVHSKIFIRKGTQKQAVDYVFKRNDHEWKQYTQLTNWIMRHCPQIVNDPADLNVLLPFVYGQMKNQGARSDLDRYVEMATQGISRAEFLAQERGAGLRYIKYYSDACAIFDGLDRNDVARANKRVLYEQYIEECENRKVAPVRFFEWECEHDFKWNEESRKHHTQLVSQAMDQRDEDDAFMSRGHANKHVLEAALKKQSKPKPDPLSKLGGISDEIAPLVRSEGDDDDEEDTTGGDDDQQ